MWFWSNLRAKHRAKQHVHKLVTEALSTEDYPISHGDDFSRIASDTHALLDRAVIQFPLAKDRMLQRYTVSQGNACTAFDEEEDFKVRVMMMNNITMKIQSLIAELAAWERESVRARNEGGGPDDGAGREFGEVGYVGRMRSLRERSGRILAALEDI
jgi:hypothetical protein